MSSPEMFNSDMEDETNHKDLVLTSEPAPVIISPHKPSQVELVSKSDNYLLARINKLLSGVPPPPKHTICQSDCNDLLTYIQQNRHYFWIPCPIPEKKNMEEETLNNLPQQVISNSTNRTYLYERSKYSSRNLTQAFDACDVQTNVSNNNISLSESTNKSKILNTKMKSVDNTESTLTTTNTATNILRPSVVEHNTYKHDDKTRPASSNNYEETLLYNSITETEATTLTWPDAYSYKFHGIHYNRNRAVEEFEDLTVKLCKRYIGAETQSTCNVWFSKQAPGSTKKRKLLAKKNSGQSPGKRLNHLAKRRRTFSSANLQGLGVSDRKQLILNVKKSISKKGKSPKGKSPRGKSPRSSAKKKVVRKLTLDGPSPHKLKLETSKRALFQSPPTDRAGPSKTSINDTPQKIKRALFPTPKKKEDPTEEFMKTTRGDTRKRKCEDQLEGPKYKWAKSLSFHCTRELENNLVAYRDHERHSSANIFLKSDSPLCQGRNDLSDTHRKKLLWAVAEALRSKGIGMGHPCFKQYASNLARTVKKFMPDLENTTIPRKPGSTSDRMLKLAKYHVLLIMDTRSTK